MNCPEWHKVKCDMSGFVSRGVRECEVDDNGHLMFTMTDNEVLDLGRVMGVDGVSPAISVEEIEGGHKLTITDAEHPDGQEINVMNGDVAIDDEHAAPDHPWSGEKTSSELNTKVDKEAGKGLSAQDFTSALKDKLDGIEQGANKTVIVDNTTTDDATKALSAAQGKALFDTKLTGTVPLMGSSGFKLLTNAKTLPVGVHLIRLTTGSDTSELPSDIASTPAQYGYAIVSVRSVNDMICVMYFCGIAEANEGVWINQSNGGTFWGWKKLIADSQEGSYTPTLIDGGTGYTCDSKSCTYTKQGKFVHLVMLFWNLNITNGTSSMLKFSLPFQQKSGNERAYGQFGYNGTGIPNAYVGASENQLFFGKHDATTGVEEYITGAMMNGKTFQFDLWYVANA